MRRRSAVCVFAHPDDEAFGPSGTIYKLSKTHDVYILCATKGQAGLDSKPENGSSITRKREKELRISSKILNVKEAYFLGFKDGCLCNNQYHKLAVGIEKYLRKLRPEIVLTYEPRGISGHIDHIMVSMVTTFVVEKLKFIKEIWYFCLPEGKEILKKDYFIYFPTGYKKRDIDRTVIVKDVWNVKEKAMRAHESQMHDAKNILKILKKFPKEEHFLVKKLP
jgi:N-acetylglucosamine malate deacetylase 2